MNRGLIFSVIFLKKNTYILGEPYRNGIKISCFRSWSTLSRCHGKSHGRSQHPIADIVSIFVRGRSKNHTGNPFALFLFSFGVAHGDGHRLPVCHSHNPCQMSFRAHFASESTFIWGSCCIVQDFLKQVRSFFGILERKKFSMYNFQVSLNPPMFQYRN